MANIPDTPITRKEKYLDAIANGTTEVPEPITREEEYLAWIALNGGGGGGGTGEVTGVKGSAESTFRKGNVSISPANIGLDKVNNTPDLNKPISNATQAALDLKVDKVEGKGLSDNNYSDDDKAIVDGVETELAKKVNKVTGKGLSTNDYTNDDKAIVDGVTAALADKVDKVQGKGLSTNDYTDTDKAIVDGVADALAGKVDKVTGKGLSANDYTNTDKAIVDGVTAALAEKADKTDVIDGASYDSANHLILFKRGTDTLFSLDAAAFVKDGMIDTVEITGGNLVITFNTDAGKQAISIPLTDIFDPSNYYNKTATDNLLADKADKVSGATNGNFAGLDANGNLTDSSISPASVASKSATILTSSDDLNNVTTPGFYYTANTDNPSNIPSGTNLNNNIIEVIKQGSISRCVQLFYSINGQKMWFRIGNSVTNPTSWSSWELIAFGSLATKADLISSPTADNLVAMDANGNIKDSGKKASDFATPENVQDSINTSADLLKDTVGWTGKNLNSYPYLHTTKTESGITFTDNGDGTVTVNGTATADAVFQCHFRANADNRNNLILPNGKYILSGCPSGGASSKYLMGANRTLNGAHNLLGADFGDGVEITLNGDDYSADKVDIGIYIQIKNGTTVNNLIFKPMLRRADISDSTYEPYHESVEVMYEEEIYGVNLLDVKATTQTINGITYTVNTDKSISVSGTASADSRLYWYDSISLNGRYIFGRVEKTSFTGVGNYSIMTRKSGSITNLHSISFNNASQLDGIEFDEAETLTEIAIYIASGAVANLKIYPMLRKATIEDGTYRPYNEQAIQNQLNDKGILGAKNVLNNNIISTTRNGVTYTPNSDGTFIANGTATANGGIQINANIDASLIEGARYKVSLDGIGADKDGTQNGIMMYVAKYLNGVNVGDVARSNKTSGFTDEFVYHKDSSFDNLYVGCYTFNNASFTNNTLKPMIRLASDPDNTYQPYAMTNRELTDKMPKAIQHTVVWNGDLNLDTNKGGSILQYGNVYLVTYWFKATGSFTGNTPIIKLPKTSLICGNYVIAENNDAAIWGGRATKDGDSYISISCPITEGNSYRAQCVFIDTEN